MPLMRLPRHPRFEIACPPLRLRAVGRRLICAWVGSALTGSSATLLLLRPAPAAGGLPWATIGAVILLLGCAASLLWLTHLFNSVRMPVTFRVANGELIITRPFLFLRRQRRLRTADVKAITVSVADADPDEATGRLSIRRRYRLPVRIPGRRPIPELDRVAGELRTVLRVG